MGCPIRGLCESEVGISRMTRLSCYADSPFMIYLSSGLGGLD